MALDLDRVRRGGVRAATVADAATAVAASDASVERAQCEALTEVRNLTIMSARLVAATASTPSYCYVKGAIPPGITYHVQLPLPSAWNGRFLKWGDGTKDGDLDFADHRLAQGYAVANSNMGHDAGRSPAPGLPTTIARRRSISRIAPCI